MVLKGIIFVVLVTLGQGALMYMLWNMVITKLPITGITIGHLSYQTALLIGFFQLIIASADGFLLGFLKGFTKDWLD